MQEKKKLGAPLKSKEDKFIRKNISFKQSEVDANGGWEPLMMRIHNFITPKAEMEVGSPQYKKILNIIECVDAYKKGLECDGMTRVLHYLLLKEGIEHKTMQGVATFKEHSVFHQWIVIDGFILDLKTKMWFGAEADEGLLKSSNVYYDGEYRPLHVTELIYKLLMNLF